MLNAKVVLNRLDTPPAANSREMRTYMAAILEVTGMMSGQGFELTRFMKNFATHLAPKANFPHPTLRVGSDGLHYVTEEGWNFFASRLSSQPIVSGQLVFRAEVVEMMRRVVSQNPSAGWSSFEVSVRDGQASQETPRN